MTDIELAEEKLNDEGVTFAAAKDGAIMTSKDRGIRPLLELYEAGTDMKGWTCADKVVGKAPAVIYTLLDVREVSAPVMTKAAKEILENSGISCTYGSLTDVILRRDGNDLCPMEKAVKDIDDPLDAVNAKKGTAALLAASH